MVKIHFGCNIKIAFLLETLLDFLKEIEAGLKQGIIEVKLKQSTSFSDYYCTNTIEYRFWYHVTFKSSTLCRTLQNI